MSQENLAAAARLFAEQGAKIAQIAQRGEVALYTDMRHDEAEQGNPFPPFLT